MQEKKYLNIEGLRYLWDQIVNKIDNLKVDSIPLVKVNQSIVELEPNKYYQLTQAQDELKIILGNIQDSTITNHYMIEFPYEGGSVTFPSYFIWVLGVPSLIVGHKYQLSVINKLAILMDFV